MIERLHLKHFGRFTNRAFQFAPSVVFHGPNESGKTTIFDALFTTLCRVPKQGAYKTDIYQRYGDAMEAEIAPEGLEGAFDPAEFRDLHSIRSGDVTLRFGDDDSWAATVKSALFSGGIDPTAVAEDLAMQSSGKTTVKHNKEIAHLKTARAQAVAERDRLEAERLRHAEQMRRGEDLTRKLLQAEEAIGRSDEAISAIAKELEQEERIQQRKSMESLYALFEKDDELRSALARMPADPAGLLAELTALEKRIAGLIAERDKVRMEAAARVRDLQGLEAQRQEVEGRQASGAALARKADLLLARVNEFLGDPYRRMKVSTSWNIPLAVGAGVVAAVAIITGILVHPLCFAGLLALIGLWYARQTVTVEDIGAALRIRMDVRDEFRNAGGGDLRSDSLQGLADELRAVTAAHDHLTEDLRRILAAIAHARDPGDGSGGDVDVIESRVRDEESQRLALLQRAGVAGREDLVARMTERKNIGERSAGIEADLRKHMATAGFSAQDAFRSDVRRRLADADREGVPREGRAPADVQKQRQLLAAEQERKRSLERSLGNMKEERGVSVGMARSMGSVLEDLLAREKEIVRVDAEIAELELNKQGAALAAEIFRAMASDSSSMLSALAAEMQSVFGGIVASTPTVAVETFNSETLRATDAGGVLRGIGHLSKGTRDTLTFAARLTLALKSDPGGEKRLLVLDEPFSSLDPSRVANALAMVRRIQDDHGWQVVLFTKDPDLAAAAVDALKEPVRYDLVEGRENGAA